MSEILILGHNGMLGNCAVKYFDSLGYRTATTPYRYPSQEFYDFLESKKWGAIINCIGAIPQNCNNSVEFRRANVSLPYDLSLLKCTKIVNAGSDFELGNGNDIYTNTKRAGTAHLSRGNHYTIRSSIIGIGGKTGLIDWLREQTEVNGFTNVMWNGITTHYWCMWARQILEDVTESNIFDIATNPISKFQLLYEIKEAFDLSVKINPVDIPVRPLMMNRQTVMMPIGMQLLGLRKFYNL